MQNNGLQASAAEAVRLLLDLEPQQTDTEDFYAHFEYIDETSKSVVETVILL